MKEIVKLEAYNIEQLVNLSGVKDENLEVLEDHFQVEISLRGDEMSIVGSQQQIEKTKKVIYSLLKLIVSGVSISRRDVIYAQKLVEKDKLDQLSELYHIKIARTYNGKLIYPKTLGQKSYYYALKNNDVVFGIGPAGTGKTYLAVVFAVAALKNNEVKKIFLTRPAVEAGENLGFLPGDLKEKVDPYLRPLYDALYDMLGVEQTEKLMEKGVPVVLVSRCFNGIAEPVYAYEGGGVKLQEAGVMFVKELNAPKARLKLLIALSAGLKGQELKDYIEG